MSMLVDNLSAFLTHPVTATVLLVVGIVGIALELLFFSSGLLAAAGIAGFAFYFLGFYLAGFAGFGDLAVFGIGIVLLILELIVPSFGILGVLGAICLFGGVLMASSDPKEAAIMLGVALLIAIITVAFAIKYFKHRGVWNRFILREQLTTDKGFTSSPDRSYLLGLIGEAITPLRPAGTALIGGERVDVVTNGGFIPSGKEVVVTEIEGNRVVVKEKND
ncbi:nodulation efficiency protein NfeD [Paenibacillus sp. SYP-B3998]|uniref:Nodulation efficiency protein NfeD n=1 Tax=Paenibacillus sp. SYP-B3998 TaxID=2678564 RepID=A0A6G3ZST5_9BACL|nr:NfeD family protein [Paenibacillus sp. SYP-B3998]NEW05202.1 nodulation efficiency protein NfeD [Paenibacillus sp. SYP-B3998]